ncbi:MAG: MarC family protein [Candidatus Nanopelagicales bacterium]
MDLRLYGSVVVTLLVIMDPPGIVPIFLALTHRRGPAQMKRLALQATLTALGVIVGFALFGQVILDYLHVSLPALQASGGLLLLLVALQLLMGKGGEVTAADDVNVALVPLGTPLIAGPGAIVAVMLFMQGASTPAAYTAVAFGVLTVHLVLFLAMRYSTGIARVLGTSGITVLTRIAGMLLAAIAAQLIANAVFGFIAEQGLG